MDTSKSRRRKNPILNLRKLKTTAIPSLHPNAPYVCNRKKAWSSSFLRNYLRQNEHIEAINIENLTRVDCDSFSDLIEKVKLNSFPTGYICHCL